MCDYIFASKLLALLLAFCISPQVAFCGEAVLAADHGVVCDGATDNSATLQSAAMTATAEGKTLILPPGICLTGQITYAAGARWIGQGPALTTIKAKNGTNADLIIPEDTTTDDASFQDIGFDGNKANNTTGITLKISGARPRLDNIFIKNSALHGIETSLAAAQGNAVLGIEGKFSRVTIDSPAGHCWYHAGPNDSRFDSIIMADCGVSANNTYFGMYMTGLGSGRFSDLHNYNRNHITNVAICGVYVGTVGNTFTNSHFEAGYTPLCLVGGFNTITSSAFYAPRGTTSVNLASSGNYIQGTSGLASASCCTNYKGITIQSTATGNEIHLSDLGSLNGAIDFKNDPGGNIIFLTGYRSSGAVYVGALPSWSYYMIRVSGAAGLSAHNHN